MPMQNGKEEIKLRFLLRILLSLIGLPLLVIPTLWATYKDLNELPWGLDKVWGNREDGWDGDGTQRHFWDLDGSVNKETGVQGWWPDYLRQQGVIWNELSFIKKWWYSYSWCALRNPAWNVRYLPYVSTSVDVLDVLSFTHEGNTEVVDGDSKVELWYNLVFENKEGVFESRYRHKHLFKNYFLHLRWGWKVYPELLSKGVTPPFKDRSVYIFQVKIKTV